MFTWSVCIDVTSEALKMHVHFKVFRKWIALLAAPTPPSWPNCFKISRAEWRCILSSQRVQQGAAVSCGSIPVPTLLWGLGVGRSRVNCQ